jgi:hypothetical protein
MKTTKTTLILGSLIFITASIVLSYFFFFRPRLEQKRIVNPQCPQTSSVIVADPEEFTYTSENVKKIVGYINLDKKSVKGLQYDLLGFKGGSGFTATIFGEISNDDLVARAGWKTVELDVKGSSITFSLEPQFPEVINKNNILGVYMRVICKDGSTSYETDIHVLRNPFPNLYFVGSTNPSKIKYFK